MFDVADILITAELNESTGGIRYYNDVYGSHHDQVDGSIHALPDDGGGSHDEHGNWRSLGRLDYAVYRGRASIKHIGVPAEHRRQGIASGLYAELLKDHPHHKIDWGYTTPDGTPFKAAMDAKHGGYIRQARIARGLERARKRDGYSNWI